MRSLSLGPLTPPRAVPSPCASPGSARGDAGRVGLGLEHLLERDQPALAVHAGARPGRLGLGAERPGHLPPHRFQQGQLVLQVRLLVGERGREPALVVADQERPLLGDHPLHSVAPRLLAVNQVADDLERAPLARHRARSQLFGAEVRDGAAEPRQAGQIGVDQVARETIAASRGSSNTGCVGSTDPIPPDTDRRRSVRAGGSDPIGQVSAPATPCVRLSPSEAIGNSGPQRDAGQVCGRWHPGLAGWILTGPSEETNLSCPSNP